jgi:electron-transferring-flavoprotein dehydrogenase
MSEEVNYSDEVAPETAVATDGERQSLAVDIACVGFGPATGGFLTTLNQAWSENPADPAFESKTMPGMPLQVLCYERADDLAAGVSGVVTLARGIRGSFPELNTDEIPMAAKVAHERVLYLLDPVGASRRSAALRIGDFFLGLGRKFLLKDDAFELPWTPAFLNKHGGLVLSIGQFNQWVAQQVMAGGLVQIWPGTPVSEPLMDGDAVKGVRLADQGVEKNGAPGDGFMPGMDVQARLTVVGDGPVGQISRTLNRKDKTARDWALGMKFVIELPEDEATELVPGTVWHTFGYPEPEIFGFFYVHPNRLVSVGIFVPSWMSDPSRTVYRYLQHYIQHPALWRVLKNGTLRSWGAKSLEETGRRGEPALCGDGFARIGENSGSTNMLTGSGVDEAWTTGTQLAEAVLELLHGDQPFTQENLAATYEKRRRASWVERNAREAEDARNGFHGGIVTGMIGMALAGLTHGRFSLKPHAVPAYKQIHPFPAGSKDGRQLQEAAKLASSEGRSLHDALLSVRGWPEIPYDGRLLVTQQDALLMGGKVQAMPGFADHVVFRNAKLCAACAEQTCVAMCSGQAITQGEDGLPTFGREKCVHCGGCLWNCSQSPDGVNGNIEFQAGSGGLHSAEN